VQEFEKFVKQDGRINLQRKEELVSVSIGCYTYDKITGAIGCSQETYIDRLLVKYGMEHANACKLPMNPGSNLESLPILDTPDIIVVRAYAALIGQLLYIVINTVPQLSYSMTSLTLYMSKATPAHLTYANVVLRYLIGIKKRQLMWCGQRVCFIQKLIQNGLINVKQCPTAAQTADIGTMELPRVLIENFTDQLIGDKHVGDK